MYQFLSYPISLKTLILPPPAINPLAASVPQGLGFMDLSYPSGLSGRKGHSAPLSADLID
jgi:hypothetical protein